jgi:hypothetical protein
MADPVAKASAKYDGREFNWEISTPRRMLPKVQPLCDAIDQFLIDHPGYRVTITIER